MKAIRGFQASWEGLLVFFFWWGYLKMKWRIISGNGSDYEIGERLDKVRKCIFTGVNLWHTTLGCTISSHSTGKVTTMGVPRCFARSGRRRWVVSYRSSLTFFEGGRGCGGKLAARSTCSLSREEAEIEARCNFFQKLEQNRMRRHTCCLAVEDRVFFESFSKEVLDEHSDQASDDSLSPAFHQYLESLRQPRHLWYQRWYRHWKRLKIVNNNQF